MTLWIGYAKACKEFEVQAALSDINITCHVARKVEMLRSGKNRRPEPVESPVLPNYVFIDVSVDRYLELAGIKHLAQTKTAVPQAEAKHVTAYLDHVKRQFDHDTAQIAAGERISQFQEGDALKVLTGPFVDRLVRFKRVVQGSKQVDDVVVGETELFGRMAEVPFDVLDVRAAE